MDNYIQRSDELKREVKPDHDDDNIDNVQNVHQFVTDQVQKKQSNENKDVRDSKRDLLQLQTQLDEQQKLAKEKFEVMMASESEASKMKKETIRVQAEVEIERKTINARSAEIEIKLRKLREVRSQLDAANKAVSGINSKQVTGLKSMKKPYVIVLKVMLAVGMVLGVKKCKDWKGCLKMFTNPKFLGNVLKFDWKKLNEKTRLKLQKNYLADKEFNFERVNKASKVAGPLVQWIVAQNNFAYLLDEVVEPMKREIIELELRMAAKQKYVAELSVLLNGLEVKIDKCSNEYQQAVQKITDLNDEMVIVENPVFVW